MRLLRATDKDFSSLWKSLWSCDPWQHALLHMSHRAYYEAYYVGQSFTDASVLVEEGGVAIAGLPLAVRRDQENQLHLGGFGRPLMLLRNDSAPVHHVRSAANMLMEELVRVRETTDARSVVVFDPLDDGALQESTRMLLLEGGKPSPEFRCLLDLSVDEITLRAEMSRSFKRFTNWGEKNLRLEIHDAQTLKDEFIDAFQALHVEVAGRETRSRKSWHIQRDIIRNDHGFVVAGYLDERLVTASFFACSQKYCYYGVGVSVRELFDKPLSHAIMWRAILIAKSRGCRWFETGEQLFPHAHASMPTEKELGISRFKAGFGGRTYAGLRVEWRRET